VLSGRRPDYPMRSRCRARCPFHRHREELLAPRDGAAFERSFPAQQVSLPSAASRPGASRGLEEYAVLAFVAGAAALVDELNRLITCVIGHGQDLR